jgi:hypothetical protein
MQDKESINKKVTKTIEMIGKSIDILEECGEEMEYDGEDLIELADKLGEVHEALMNRD